jgi:hypothetical protein
MLGKLADKTLLSFELRMLHLPLDISRTSSVRYRAITQSNLSPLAGQVPKCLSSIGRMMQRPVISLPVREVPIGR